MRAVSRSRRVAALALALWSGGSVVQPGIAWADSALGKGHLWIKSGMIDLGDASRAWGADREGYLALEGYGSVEHRIYLGGEIGHLGSGRGTTSIGERIRDFDLLWMEFNGKMAFPMRHGFSVDVGLGSALFYAEGVEVSSVDGREFTAPLADVGFGAQLFVDLNGRARRLLFGLDAKYQWAVDIFGLDYSNLRLGAHLGMAF